MYFFLEQNTNKSFSPFLRLRRCKARISNRFFFRSIHSLSCDQIQSSKIKFIRSSRTTERSSTITISFNQRLSKSVKCLRWMQTARHWCHLNLRYLLHRVLCLQTYQIDNNFPYLLYILKAIYWKWIINIIILCSCRINVRKPDPFLGIKLK